MENEKIKRGIVWCTECGESLKVNANICLQGGWPRCCGYTMTIDSPQERKFKNNQLKSRPIGWEENK